MLAFQYHPAEGTIAAGLIVPRDDALAQRWPILEDAEAFVARLCQEHRTLEAERRVGRLSLAFAVTFADYGARVTLGDTVLRRIEPPGITIRIPPSSRFLPWFKDVIVTARTFRVLVGSIPMGARRHVAGGLVTGDALYFHDGSLASARLEELPAGSFELRAAIAAARIVRFFPGPVSGHEMMAFETPLEAAFPALCASLRAAP